MRIAIITENFLPKVDGVTRTLARLLEHLQQTSHQVLLLGPETQLQKYAGARLVGTIGIPFVLYPELKLNLWRPQFTQELLEFQPDVIHLVDPVFLGAVGLAVIRYYLPKTAIVSSYHTNLAVYCDHFGYGFLTRLMWRWNRFCHSFSHTIACPSPSTLSILDAHGFENINLWPRGVDISLFSPAQRSDHLRWRWWRNTQDLSDSNKSILLYVGRVSFEKNIKLVIEAYRGMDHTQCHLVIVGHGPAFDEIQALCSTARIPVTFTGYLQGQSLSQAYASADIFAFPSTSETFGQVVLEAMASGLPVVAIEAEGVKDLVCHQRTGLLLNAVGLSLDEQIIAYRKLLVHLVTQKNVCDEMSQEAMKEAKAYTWYEAMHCMVEIYQQAAGCAGSSVAIKEDGEDSGVEEDYVPENETIDLSQKNKIDWI